MPHSASTTMAASRYPLPRSSARSSRAATCFLCRCRGSWHIWRSTTQSALRRRGFLLLVDGRLRPQADGARQPCDHLSAGRQTIGRLACDRQQAALCEPFDARAPVSRGRRAPCQPARVLPALDHSIAHRRHERAQGIAPAVGDQPSLAHGPSRLPGASQTTSRAYRALLRRSWASACRGDPTGRARRVTDRLSIWLCDRASRSALSVAAHQRVTHQTRGVVAAARVVNTASSRDDRPSRSSRCGVSYLSAPAHRLVLLLPGCFRQNATLAGAVMAALRVNTV
jgi:hypothetical protein